MRLCLLFCSGNIEISILKLKMCHPPILGAQTDFGRQTKR